MAGPPDEGAAVAAENESPPPPGRAVMGAEPLSPWLAVGCSTVGHGVTLVLVF